MLLETPGEVLEVGSDDAVHLGGARQGEPRVPADRTVRDRSGGVLAAPVEPELGWSYFERGPERNPIGGYEPDMLVYHHTVGDYHEALTEAGVTVERLLEPGDSDPEVYEEQWSHKPDPMAMVPPALGVKAVV